MGETDCAPTELDSSDSGDDFIIIDDEDENLEVPNTLRPFWHVPHMQLKINRCVSVSHPGHSIWFDLCPPAGNIGDHVAHTLDRILSIGCHKEHAFKFGITSMPSVRWTAFPDYKYLDLMVLIYTSENSDDTARYERQCIGDYRSDNRLQNRAPGGENAHCGLAPHFLYIVFGKRHQFEQGRVISRLR